MVSEAVLQGPEQVWVEEMVPGVCLSAAAAAAALQAGQRQHHSPADPKESIRVMHRH